AFTTRSPLRRLKSARRAAVPIVPDRPTGTICATGLPCEVMTTVRPSRTARRSRENSRLASAAEMAGVTRLATEVVILTTLPSSGCRPQAPPHPLVRDKDDPWLTPTAIWL